MMLSFFFKLQISKRLRLVERQKKSAVSTNVRLDMDTWIRPVPEEGWVYEAMNEKSGGSFARPNIASHGHTTIRLSVCAHQRDGTFAPSLCVGRFSPAAAAAFLPTSYVRATQPQLHKQSVCVVRTHAQRPLPGPNRLSALKRGTRAHLEREEVGTVRRQHARLPQQLHSRREHLPVTGAALANQTFLRRYSRITARRRRRRQGCGFFRRRQRTRRGLREGQEERQPSLLRCDTSVKTNPKKNKHIHTHTRRFSVSHS